MIMAHAARPDWHLSSPTTVNVRAPPALWPHRLLQWVESFAPLWLGGHIVGFVSFFCWMLYTESDLLKSDKLLTGTK